jgi:hypothetical protein
MNLRQARTITLTVVAVAIPCIRHFQHLKAPAPHALQTVLPHPCSADEVKQITDTRDIWLRYLINQRAMIN